MMINKEIENKKPSGVGGILVAILRDILLTFNITGTRFHVLIERFIKDNYNHFDSSQITSIRGNLRKEITKEDMTWKVFIKWLKILRYSEIEIVFKLKRANGEVSVHSRNIIFDDNREDILSDCSHNDKITDLQNWVIKLPDHLIVDDANGEELYARKNTTDI